MKLYYNPSSSNSRRVEAVIRQLGRTDVEMVLLNHYAGEHHTPEFEAVNPNLKLPALRDADFTLWESNAIMQYLADGTPLFPNDARARADISRWQFWTSGYFGPTTAALVFERGFKESMGMGEASQDVIDAETAKLEALSKVLDQHLEGREYLVGGRLTIADFAVCAEMSFNQIGQLDFSSYTNITAWEERLNLLPAWRETEIQLPG